MNVYMAAVHWNEYMPGQKLYPALNEHEQRIMHELEFILESYHYLQVKEYTHHIRDNGKKVFLDSGAFTAWTMGVPLEIPEYVDYVQRNRDIIREEDGVLMASVLDAIGDPLVTWQNQQTMEQMGVRPLPCFHYGDDERYLEWYLQNYTYITLGGMVGKSREALTQWLDRLWAKYLLDGTGNPKCKIHAFGITSKAIMERYPWHSVDSSSWVQAAGYGFLWVPGHRNITLSEKSGTRKQAWKHLFNISSTEQEYILKMFESQGFNAERLATVYQSRAAYNLWSIPEIGRRLKLNPEKYRYRPMDLFDMESEC